MRRTLTLSAAAAAVLVALTGCNPKGQSCSRPGDLKVSGGTSYVCKSGPRGNTWQ